MSINNEGLRLIKAEITNFKNIDHKIVEFDGRSVVILGPNKAGKSSLIQALMSPMNAKYMPPVPIKKGEESGSVQLNVSGTLYGNKEDYRIETYFSQEHKNGRLKLFKNDEEIKNGAASILKNILGNISFDVFHFINLAKTSEGKVSKSGTKEQAETLKQFLSDEEKKKIFDLDAEYKKKYSDRTIVNHEIDTLQAEINGSKYTQEEIDRYSTPKPDEIKKIQDKLSVIGKSLEDWNKVNNGVEQCKAQISGKNSYDTDKSDSLIATIESVLHSTNGIDDPLLNEIAKELSSFISSMHENIDQCKKQNEFISDIKLKISKGESWLAKNKKPTVDALNKELNDATEYNNHHRNINNYLEKHKTLSDKKSEVEKITKRLSDIQDEKKAVFASSKMPVKGLSIDEDQVLYNGLPFTEEQHPTSVIIGIGVKIAMAMNPNLKVIVIKDGSLLDKTTLKTIIGMANKYGYQLLIEIVSMESEGSEVKFTEDFIN